MKKSIKSNVGLGVNVQFISFNKKTGKVNKQTKKHNLVVNSGLDAVADLIVNEFNYLAIGTGTAAILATDIELDAEFTRELVTATDEGVGIREIDHTFTVGSGVSEDIEEAGLFNSATPSGSVMLNRALAGTTFTLDEDNPLRVIVTLTTTNP